MGFRVGWMSQIFAADHRIRVTISCTGLPLYETGGNGTDEAAGRATHTVLHSATYASHVLAPVIPMDEATAARECVDVSEEYVRDLKAGVFPA